MSETEKKGKFPPIEIRALRRKEEGTFERLLCQLLIRANSSEGLQKIELMCQAFYRAKTMLPHNPVEIKEDEVEVIYAAATALANVVVCPLPTSSEGSFYKILWSFKRTPENYERFIRPWNKSDYRLVYYPFIGDCYNYEELYNKAEEYFNKLNDIDFFFLITTGQKGSYGLLCKSSYHSLKNWFIVWAMPKVDGWFMELSKLVDQSVFDSVLKTMYGAKEREKELEE
jgi:hypothetical protein